MILPLRGGDREVNKLFSAGVAVFYGELNFYDIDRIASALLILENCPMILSVYQYPSTNITIEQAIGSRWSFISDGGIQPIARMTLLLSSQADLPACLPA
jgi:hypothetical protein